MRIDLRQPCAECPFRRSSPAGWLGPWTAEDIIFHLNANPFPCHKTIKSDDQAIDDASLQGCAGAAQFLNNQVKLSRDPETALHQKRLGRLHPGAHPDVFDWPSQFLTHHRPERKRA